MVFDCLNQFTLQKTKRLRTVFSIGHENRTGDTLLLEFGPDYCCYAFMEASKKSFHFIRYISFNELEAETDLNVLMAVLEKHSFDKVVCCSAYSQGLLVPQQFSGHKQLLDAIYAVPLSEYKTDRISEWQLNNAYALPLTIYERIVSSFPAALFFHAFTPALKIYNGFVAPDQVDIHFTIQFFRILVKKNNEIRLAQTYAYKTPLDVVYYLLKICYEFHLDQKETFLIVSGLIEQDSALYHELHNYFLNLHFAQAPAYALPDNEHPHYYFTSLYNLAACVS
jgi:hypothetical protein